MAMSEVEPSLDSLSAYLAGGRAFDTRLALTDNPFNKNDLRFNQWRAGYIDASRQVTNGWKGIINKLGRNRDSA